MKSILKWFLMCLFVRTSNTTNYCNLTCKVNGKIIKHVLCDEEVDKNVCDVKMNIIPKEELLSLHNQFRQNISKAEGNGFAPPSIRPLDDLVWDDHLSVTAQAVGLSCLDRENHCRSDEEFKLVAQYINKYPIHKLPHKDQLQVELLECMKNMFLNWTKLIVEEKDAANIIKKYRYGPWSAGTQILWAKTREVGCAGVTFRHSKKVDDVWVRNWYHSIICHYGEAGNIAGQEVYEVGDGPFIPTTTSEESSTESVDSSSESMDSSSESVDSSSASTFLPPTFTDLTDEDGSFPSTATSPSSPNEDPTISIVDDDYVEENKSAPLVNPTLVPVVHVLSDASPSSTNLPNNVHFWMYVILVMSTAMSSLPDTHVL